MGNIRYGVALVASARRFAGLGLAAVLGAALAGCDGGSDSPTVPAPVPAPAPAPEPAPPPSKDDPAAFTQAFVQRAVDLFEAEGLEPALAAYNDPASVDESWYVFVMDAEGVIIAHPTVPENLGASVLGPLGVDSAGHVFGPALAAATEDGVWVDYNYFNPATGDEGIKHTWAVRRDGTVFASGWYEGAPTDSSIEGQTQGVVRQAVGLGPRARTGGGARLLRHARLHERPVVRRVPRPRGGRGEPRGEPGARGEEQPRAARRGRDWEGVRFRTADPAA